MTLRGWRSRKASKAAAAADAVNEKRGFDAGVVLGRHVGGERSLPVRDGNVYWPVPEVLRHAVIFGESGMGKTETALRIVFELALNTDFQVFFLDGKGSRATAERFVGLMEMAGRRVRVSPNEPMDLWRGDWRGIVNRLLEVISYTSEGPASYYRDIAKVALRLACHHPDGPPRSSGELLSRLNLLEFRKTHPGDSAVDSVASADLVEQMRMRYEAFFGQMGGVFDGDWGFDEADAGYVLLDSVSMGEDARGSAAMVFSDFAHYFKERKPRERGCVLVIDEFSAIASSSDVAMRVEQAREFNAGIVMLPQSPFGMGGEEQRRRILGAVGTVMTHGSKEAREIAALAGTKMGIDVTRRVSEVSEPMGLSVRSVEVPRLDPSKVLLLGKGEVWVIHGGAAGKVAVERAPLVSAELPPAVELYVEPKKPGPPKKLNLPYLDSMD